MKKLVLNLDLHDEKQKQKAMKAVSGLPGIDSISMDMKERKLTVIGEVDPVTVVSKLRKNWTSTAILSVGLAKEPEKKKDDGKKDGDKKKDDGKKKKDDGKKDGEKKKDDGDKKMDGEKKKDDVMKKKDDGKKDGNKKKEGERKKDDGKKDGDKGRGEEERPQQAIHRMHEAYGYLPYPPSCAAPEYVQTVEENPHYCVIC